MLPCWHPCSALMQRVFRATRTATAQRASALQSEFWNALGPEPLARAWLDRWPEASSRKSARSTWNKPFPASVIFGPASGKSAKESAGAPLSRNTTSMSIWPLLRQLRRPIPSWPPPSEVTTSSSPMWLSSAPPEEDETINTGARLVDKKQARLTPLRRINSGSSILHASVSCKWTLRSDRAQNARSEALNLVRNRKGRLPHIAVVTGEPSPSRIASIALGTGDIDCVYHFALPELLETVKDLGFADAGELLDTMIGGKRLRDIADLPLDLVI